MARTQARFRTTPGLKIPATYTITRKGGRFDLRDPYHLAVRITWPHFVLLFVGFNLLLNLIFAGLYMAVPGSIANAQPASFADAFFFSFETLATVGYGAMSPATLYAHIVATIEIMCGMGFTAIMTGITFVRFARPTAKVAYAEKAIVTMHEGQPTLMIRIGNDRVGLISDATARLTVLLLRRSAEGQSFRMTHILPLRSDRLPVFALTWTIMHIIDEASPLYGINPEWLEAHNPVFFLTFEGRDPALAAQVHDVHQYGAADIAFSHRYVDVVATDPAGRIVADLTRISHIEPE